ncbi:MAG: HD domain-containing protein [bacterium]
MDRKIYEEYLFENVKNPNLLKHMYAVEQVLKSYARAIKSGEVIIPNTSKDEIEKIDSELWALTGLMHDADWEAYPDKHPVEVVKWLTSKGSPIEMIDAIHSHGSAKWAEENGGNLIDDMPRFVERKTLLDKVLFASDEMSGMIIATSLMRPNRLLDLEAKSVIKKIKDKGFARGVNREDLTEGVTELGIPMDLHITFMIKSLRTISDRLF